MADIHYWTAREQAAAIRNREISSEELVHAHLSRIEQIDPMINAMVTVQPEHALELARKADARTMSGESLGPLHGLPIAHKDTLETAGLRTTHGSPIFSDNIPTRSQLVVERTHAAGAIPIGKTNVPELGLGSHTVNPLFGATRNPYDRTRSAGGSSGGAAAALAAGLIPIADGSDTGGSLRNPASFNNILGIRSSASRVPTWPNKAAWGYLSVKGPLARNVGDLQLLLSVMSGPDPRSPISFEDDNPLFEYERSARGLKIAWAPDLGGLPVDPDVTATLAATVGALPSMGCHLEQACPDLSGADEVFLTLRAWQLELSYGPLLDTQRSALGPNAIWNIQQGRTLTGHDIGRAEILRTELFHRMRAFFDDYDLLLAPVSQVAPFPIEWNYPTTIDGEAMNTYLDWMKSAYLISATGCPAMSVPGGFTPTGLPVGLQIIGPHRNEARLLQLAHAIETATEFGQRRPHLPPTHI
ncbi:amidase (plasmid) [Rhodococcus pseudokoreensis]|uniref:Amidase n=1 Tax=Rhodococcus pseudokoreensis TaxID=2811421 RepID=A0A974VXA0_9NOCA|nr:amidase [Rhodococcus pseudokoreensis]QSE87329.1 amidase [Rhodococcus pseudokoreensis]